MRLECSFELGLQSSEGLTGAGGSSPEEPGGGSEFLFPWSSPKVASLSSWLEAWLAPVSHPKKQNVWVSCCSRFSKISAVSMVMVPSKLRPKGLSKPRWKWDWWGICVTAEGGKTVALTITVMRVTAFIVGQAAIPDLSWEETHKGVDTREVRLT